MLGRARSFSVAVLVLGACNPPPEEVTTGGSGSSDTSAGTTAMTTVAPGTTATPEESSGIPPSETTVDTTMGAVDGTTGDSSSSGSPPGCGDGPSCGSNEVCEDGACVDVCGGAWGEGSYDYCLDEFGGFDTLQSCGRDHVCVYWGDPITQTTCALQGCVEACDCPPPPASGNATVTCGEITDPARMNDCYLSCENGEECPTGMSCAAGGTCAADVSAVAIYGDCGNLATDCAAPGFCVVPPSGEAVCATSCADVVECAVAVPAGGDALLICSDITPAVGGFECNISCIGGLTCPDGMTCVNGTLCMWPD